MSETMLWLGWIALFVGVAGLLNWIDSWACKRHDAKEVCDLEEQRHRQREEAMRKARPPVKVIEAADATND